MARPTNTAPGFGRHSRRYAAALGAVGLSVAATCALALAPVARAATSQQAFANTGEAQSFTVPAGVSCITVDAFGAAGGTADAGTENAAAGGEGGHATAQVPVTAGEVLQVNVGGQGADGNETAGGLGGFNGGGDAGSLVAGGGGGGASDVRRGAFGLADRLVVAGGGGGGATFTNNDGDALGGAGGGTVGDPGSTNGDGSASPGLGGTQSVGGAGGANFGPGTSAAGENGTLGQGGSTVFTDTYNGSGGGGGGGYFGGGAGGSVSPGGGTAGGGGGGSGFGPAGTTFETGVHSGDGSITISWDLATGPGCDTTPIQPASEVVAPARFTG